MNIYGTADIGTMAIETPINIMMRKIALDRKKIFNDIFAEANQSPYKKNIIFRDHITDKDRLLFYNSASVFVYPSFFEGFGFPPLEAITCNVPTIIANTSSLPEIVGRASLMVDPSNLDEIADAMTMAINDSRLRERMISRVLNIQENFSWGKTAEKTLACLINLCDKN